LQLKIQNFVTGVKEVCAYSVSTCEDLKHATGIIDATSVNSVVVLHVV